jgi:hypothetical protein
MCCVCCEGRPRRFGVVVPRVRPPVRGFAAVAAPPALHASSHQPRGIEHSLLPSSSDASKLCEGSVDEAAHGKSALTGKSGSHAEVRGGAGALPERDIVYLQPVVHGPAIPGL